MRTKFRSVTDFVRYYFNKTQIPGDKESYVLTKSGDKFRVANRLNPTDVLAFSIMYILHVKPREYETIKPLITIAGIQYNLVFEALAGQYAGYMIFNLYPL